MKKILVVAAHPDDEILGCGGTSARLAKAGAEIYTLILGEGVGGRYESSQSLDAAKEVVALKQQMRKANEIIGIKEVFPHDFADNRFDSVTLLDIVKVVEKVKSEIEPDTIFTHYEKDLNVDHQITYKAVITAARPIQGESVREIYSFEVLSSTEWAYPLSFSPDVFFDISETLEQKIHAMQAYESELREFPHPRSLEAVKVNAKGWGMKVGFGYAEAFKCVRVLK